MALTSGITHITDSVKMGGDGEYCYLCVKKYCRENNTSMADSIHLFKGKIANTPVMYERTSGIDKCFCMNCLKETIDIIEPLMPNK